VGLKPLPLETPLSPRKPVQQFLAIGKREEEEEDEEEEAEEVDEEGRVDAPVGVKENGVPLVDTG
jgi:hypothetical protein